MLIFVYSPAFLSGITGLLSTIINVYTAQHGDFSITAKVTAIVTGACTGVAFALFLIYNNWMLDKVRNSHRQDFMLDSDRKAKRESVGHMMKRKAQEPALQPGSVV